MKKVFVLIFSFLIAFTCSACKNKLDLSTLSENLTTYNIDINLNVDEKTAEVNQTVDYINNTNCILKQIKFHLYPQFFEEGSTKYIVANTHLNQAYPNGISYATFEIQRIVLNSTDINILYEDEQNSILNVNLLESLLPNKSVKIQIEYSFSLPNCEHRFGYGDNTINLANFYPIACVYENNEFVTNPYNSNGDPFYSDASNYNVNISLNKDYTVASSGEQISSQTNNQTKTIKFNAKVVRDFAMVISKDFKIITEELNNTKIQYYYYNDANFNSSIKAGVDAIKTFSKIYGNFPYKTFSIVQCDFIYGGMEYPNLIMISDSIKEKDDYMNVIIHETAHQWWYGMVGNNEFEHPWLDEALTEYSTILFYDYNTGYNLTHEKMIKVNKENYSTFITVYNDVLGNIDTSMRSVDKYETEPEYTYCTYVKGVLMYESLYSLVGEKAFLKSLKNYFSSYQFKNAKPENLISCFESSSKQSLQNFFNSWISGKVVIR